MITVDTSSFVPPYEQVRAQFAMQITSHTLVTGTRLPTVRRLAEDLGLAVNTVARAYRELEAAGLVETKGRGGTVVSAAGSDARRQVELAAREYARLVLSVGVGESEAVGIVRAALSSAGPRAL